LLFGHKKQKNRTNVRRFAPDPKDAARLAFCMLFHQSYVTQ